MDMHFAVGITQQTQVSSIAHVAVALMRLYYLFQGLGQAIVRFERVSRIHFVAAFPEAVISRPAANRIADCNSSARGGLIR